jgi:hypothetical protein
MVVIAVSSQPASPSRRRSCLARSVVDRRLRCRAVRLRSSPVRETATRRRLQPPSTTALWPAAIAAPVAASSATRGYSSRTRPASRLASVRQLDRRQASDVGIPVHSPAITAGRRFTTGCRLHAVSDSRFLTGWRHSGPGGLAGSHKRSRASCSCAASSFPALPT